VVSTLVAAAGALPFRLANTRTGALRADESINQPGRRSTVEGGFRQDETAAPGRVARVTGPQRHGCLTGTSRLAEIYDKSPTPAMDVPLPAHRLS